MNKFSYKDYRPLLKDCLVELKRHVSKEFTFTSMANHCRMQKTYLSRVLGGNGHLNEDQLYLCMEFLRLQDNERQFVELLHTLQRSTNQKRRRELQGRLDTLVDDATDSREYINVSSVTEDQEHSIDYYLDPWVPIAHMALTLDTYSQDPSQLVGLLGISKDILQRVLETLQRLGYISFRENGVEVLVSTTHLAATSKTLRAYYALQRGLAENRLLSLAPNQKYQFNVAFSANPEIFEEIKAGFLNLLSKVQPRVVNCEATDLYQMEFSLFPWT